MRLSLLQKHENAHEDSVWTAAWGPDGGTLVTGSVDESVKLWNEAGDTLEQKHQLVGLSLGVVGVDVDASGKYGASSSLDSYVTVWDMADYSTLHQFTNIPPSETWGLTFAPPGAARADKLLLAVAGGTANGVRLLDVGAKAEAATLDMPQAADKQRREKFVLSVAYSPDGRRIAAGGMDGTVALFDAATGKLLHTLDGHFKPVRNLTFTPDSKQVITACDDNHAHLYDAEHGELIEAFSGHESWVLSVSAHPSGAAFATGSSDSKVKLWDLSTRTCAQTCSEHTDQPSLCPSLPVPMPLHSPGTPKPFNTSNPAATTAAAAAGLAAAPQPIDCTGFEPPSSAQLTTDFLGPLQFVNAGNNRLAYRRFQLGGAPGATPLVLIIGYGATMSSWGPTLLACLAAQREVFIFDGLAQGLSSEVQPRSSSITPAVLEEATLAFIDALNLTRPHIAGLSLGACVALKIAADRPDRVGKVISWAGTSPDGRAVVGSFSTMHDLFDASKTMEDHIYLFFNLSSLEGKRAACFWLSEKRRMPPDESHPATNLRLSKGIKEAVMPWKWASWRALEHCAAPVLLMGGEDDVIIPKRAATRLAAHVPGAWLAQFPNAGHGFLWQHMDQVVAVMEAFLMDGAHKAGTTAGGGNGGPATVYAGSDEL
ncbi:hypothetical protein ABPG75_006959 [Micractinium tetrahymenae]